MISAQPDSPSGVSALQSGEEGFGPLKIERSPSNGLNIKTGGDLNCRRTPLDLCLCNGKQS